MSTQRPADDDLERLLAEAKWPELESPELAETVDRLSHAWHELRRAEPPRRKRAAARWAWVSIGSLAAAVIIATSVLVLRGLPSAKQHEQAALLTNLGTGRPATTRDQLRSRPSRSEHSGSARQDGSIAVAEDAVKLSPQPAEPLVREPNTYERVLLLAQARARAERTAIKSAVVTMATRGLVPGVEAQSTSPAEMPLDQHLASGSPLAVARFLALVAEPSQREAALAALKRTKNPPIDSIAVFLDDPRRTVRLAAAHALSTLDDPQAVEQLGQSVGGIGRQEALMALLASRSPLASDLVDAARQNLYLMASVRAAEQQLLTLQTENGENLP
jgi:hypothetical protein